MLPVLIIGLYLCIDIKVILIEWRIVRLGSVEIYIPLIFDSYGLIFSAAVLFISANVLSFANYYMEGEVFIKRFILLVILFVISINFLIYIPHMMGLLLGWDGLGLVSFVLVIYYQNSKSLAAGIITALSNRVGDVILLLSIGWRINQGHWQVLNIWDSAFSVFVVFSVIVAAITKSAQIPFSSWLPAAMAAPTPVRALVHSSTLVTAGVFLLIRFYPFLSSVSGFTESILVIASMTIFIAGIRALVECDMKKIIALSTLRQLGVIMASIGLGMPDLAFFHLITHALFKALLFVCAGTLIHLHHHSQDLRRMGNLANQIPITISCLNIANMALCGLPFLSGFYSKDLIIEMSLFNSTNVVILVLFIIATIITAAYSIRLIITCLLGINVGMGVQYVSDESLDNTWPILILTLGAVVGGCTINWFIFMPISEPILRYRIKLLAFVVTLLGGFIMWGAVLILKRLTYNMKVIHDSRAYIWFIVPMSTQIMMSEPFKIGKINLRVIDQGWVESIGAQGSFKFFEMIFKKYQLWQSSIITGHLRLIIVFLLLIFIICLGSLKLSVTLKLLRWCTTPWQYS